MTLLIEKVEALERELDKVEQENKELKGILEGIKGYLESK